MSQQRQVQYSVLMSVYQKDNAEWLAMAMESMLQQSCLPSELVLVEDGPLTEELYTVIKNKQKVYPEILRTIILEKNQGLGLALRRGVEECRYEWIARMDSDDYSRPDRIEKQLAAAECHSADIVGSDAYEFQEDLLNRITLRAFPETHEELVRFARKKTPFAHPSVLMKKSCVLAAGNYTDAYLHEDYDLFLRMLMNGSRGYTVKEPLISVRASEDFYARRGGFGYLKQLLRFNWKAYLNHWIGASDFIVRSGGNILVCLIPNSLRVWVYKNCLRKRVPKEQVENN